MAYVNSTSVARKGTFDRLIALNASVATWVRQRRVYAQTLTELSALSDRELNDLGISRLAISEIAHEAAYGK